MKAYSWDFEEALEKWHTINEAAEDFYVKLDAIDKENGGGFNYLILDAGLMSLLESTTAMISVPSVAVFNATTFYKGRFGRFHIFADLWPTVMGGVVIKNEQGQMVSLIVENYDL